MPDPPQQPKLAFGLDGASIVIKIRNKTYTLTAPELKISPGGSLPGDLTPIRFRYEEDYEDAIDLGTLRALMSDLQSMLVPLTRPPGAPAVEPFLTQWGSITQKLSNAPILGGAISTVTETTVRIHQIELELSKLPEASSPPNAYKAKFRVGLIFTPDPARRPTLFNIQIVAFGAAIWLELEGNIYKTGTVPPA